MSFNNNLNLIKKIAANLPKGKKICVLYDPDVEVAATDLSAFGIETIPFQNNIKFALTLIPKLSTAKIIFCDNYFAFLAGFTKSKKTKIVQVWHANGAIKKFGWDDPTTINRSYLDKKRFQKVYNQFDDFVVASKAMGNVFASSYHVDHDKMQYLGYPRSDRLFSNKWINYAQNRVYKAAPELKNKRVILYAPTYRDGLDFNPPEDLGRALTADKDAMVVVKLHPVLKNQESKIKQFSDSNICFYNQLSTTDLLSVTDTLITDYSSLAFDFSLLPNAKSILFFMFDLDKYKSKPGIQNDFIEWLPTNPIIKTSDLKMEILNKKDNNFEDFNHYWNTYNDGNATNRLIKKYIKNM
ncbi:CDP-glycerol glycerophosphotransferase family protein [Lactobacillus sp. S2-2]|uniref:CDP-glycerol glycerophosphotransferase family protein n=1 Tax=Lactobacillus sp. S2-2 TaxID=2692917 RepID=UPI001EFFA24C|nr:CDP-glycerol glycerophosphotransferase family protein [Lactobacillus sp. S2-2]